MKLKSKEVQREEDYTYQTHQCIWMLQALFLLVCNLITQTSDAPILKKLQDDPVLKKENKELKKALFEHKIMIDELQRKLVAQQEEAKVREENLIKSNNQFKEEMKKQSETTNSLISDLMDMVQRQAKP